MACQVAFDEWDADRYLPADLQRRPRRPRLSRSRLTERHAVLVGELMLAESLWQRRN